MEHDTSAIVTRLQAKGASVLDLLDVYQSSDYDPLWRGSPELYRAFAKKLVSAGHPNRAFELARGGLARHADDRELTYLLASALARGGNVSAAETHLSKLLSWGGLEPSLLTDALSLEGRLAKDRYDRAKMPERRAALAAKSAASYKKASDVSGGNPFPLVNAATMTLLAGNVRQAKQLARDVIDLVRREPPDGREEYWRLATLGEAYLLQGAFDEAAALYRQAVAKARETGDAGSIAAMRRNALLLKEQLEVDDQFFRPFYVGSVVVFAGHMLDHPARTARQGLAPRFPADSRLIDKVSAEIKNALEEFKANIGFCSAACGSDILFAEAMLERQSELHVVMPFAKDDFYGSSVDFKEPALESWRGRFDAVLKGAKEIHYATKESYLGHQVLFEFVNSFTQGLAVIRAQQRGVAPQALVVLDAATPNMTGGTASFLATWTKAPHPVRTIDLAASRESILGPDAAPAPVQPATQPAATDESVERQVKCMLFADVKDFSKMREEFSPRFFLNFLHEVHAVLGSLPTAPTFGNTWGDGLYLVFDHVADCAEAALRLLERAEQMPWQEMGFGETTPVRIGVHAGPVYSGVDPIIGKKNYFGSHVNRAARIEPVTTPGCAYTSEQFAALLAIEPGHEFVCEYIGIESLHKKYDLCPLYRLTRR